MVDELAKLAIEVVPNKEKQKATAETTEVVLSRTTNNAPDVLKRKEGKIKCKFEDQGKCKSGPKCQYFHPKHTCQAHGKLGSCQYKDVCELRHPVKLCFQWEKEGNCLRGDLCRFRHPLELLKNKHFLGKRPPPQQDPQFQQLPQQSVQWKQKYRYNPQPHIQQMYIPPNQNIVHPWSLPMNNFWLMKQNQRQ